MAPSTKLAVNDVTPLIDRVNLQEPWREKSKMLAATMKAGRCPRTGDYRRDES